MESAGRILNPRAVIKPSMSAEKAGPPQATPILDKFRALLKQREEEEEAELRTDEVVRVYEAVLSELTFNSKPIITDLTIIAGEQRQHGEGIADAICARILEVPDDQKLPSLYLLDSVVKNIGREYVRYFSFRLPEVFCEAYRQVHHSLYPSMRHLFGTWSSVFPPSVLHKIEAQLHFASQPGNHSTAVNSLRASESPRPTHGIHVNPKYLRQLEQPSPDNHTGGSTSNLLSGQNPATRFDDYDAGHTDPIPTAQVGTKRLKPIAGNSPGGLVEGTLHQVFNYGQNLARATDRDDLSIPWKRRLSTGDNQDQVGASIPSVIGNGMDNQGPRALIYAYGDDKRAKLSSNKPWHTEILDVNILGNRVAPGSWKNTEEEEFDWEDMSPTLADGVSKSSLLPSSLPPFRRIGARPPMSTPIQSDPGIQRMRSSQAQIPRVDDSSNNVDDALMSGRGSLGLNNQVMAPRLPQERLDLPHRFPPLLHTRITRDLQTPLSGVGLSSSPIDSMIPVDKSLEKDLQVVSLPSVAAVSSSTNSGTPQTWLGDAVSSLSGPWPPINVHKSYPPSAQPILPLQKQIGNQFGPLNASGSLTYQGLHRPLFTSERPFQSFDSKDNLQLLPNPNAATRPFMSRVGGENFPSSGLPSVTLYPLPPSLNQTSNIQGPSAVVSMIPSYSVSSIPSLPVNSNPNILHKQLGVRPPLPLGPPPRMIPTNHNASQIVPNQSAGGAFSGLINSLMAQGLISLKNPASSQDPLGLEFDADLLKLRHESAISALYSDLPRQCTTCGLRFKCQEQHSSHMDWHVTKNRMSKNRKQKPSRKWFVSASMWLSGAEALGTDSVPGFLPIETAVEKKDDEELAVPADEEQTTCALCGESFDDFYSDETEEWMYRGAVYLNAPKGSYAGMDKSQLGPIVHAKCRPETDAVP